MIIFDEKKKVFHLANKAISYLMQIEQHGYLTHLYYGKKVNRYSGNYDYPKQMRSFSPYPESASDDTFSLDTVMLEFPGAGFGDFREPAYQVVQENGSRILDFRYHSHEIRIGKPELVGLPHLYVTDEKQAETLIVCLVDSIAKLRLELLYTVIEDYPAVIRSTRLVNEGLETVAIEQLASQSLDFPNREFELIQFNGAWARERQLTREKIEIGTKILDSKRGASSHHQNPFVVLVEPKTDEFQGEAFGSCFVYSGNHQTVIEKDTFNQTRLIMGINPFQFSWVLEPAMSFQTPEVVSVYSGEGLNALSHTYHELFNTHLVRGKHQQQQRPTLINNWEATYFDFNDEKIYAIVDEAHALGIELFVLDDGWFGHRSDDCRALGDWFEFEGKLANGLKGLSEYVHQKGMKFGLWIEPEMISKESQLYEAHPDWVLHTPQRPQSPSRQQHVLDFSRQEIRNYIYEQLAKILEEVEIDYIKWDMNRNMTEVYSLALPPEKQGEVSHRYILGVYEFAERLLTDYPDLLIEGCSGGGGRFDAGMLYYTPQIWTSDDTDAVERLKIQYSTSFAYPISTMGAHVSAVPNHQTERKTSLEMRGNVAMAGVFGYELDITDMTNEEKQKIKEQVSFYKQHRELFQYGTFIRLLSPYEGNDCAWMFVSQDQKKAIVFYYRVLAQASAPHVTLKLAGLNPDYCYQSNQIQAFGDEWMQIGVYIDPTLSGDYVTQRIVLEVHDTPE